MVGLSDWLGGVGMWVGWWFWTGSVSLSRENGDGNWECLYDIHAKLLFSGREESHRIQFREIIPDFNQT